MGRRGAKVGACGLLAAWTLGGCFAFGQAAQPPAQQAPARAAEGPPSIDVDTLLKRWEVQSAKLKTLDVTIFRKDDIPEFDEVEYYEGRAIFKSPNLAFIDFKKIKQDDQRKPVRKDEKTWDSVPEERIQCTGSEVWQYKCDTQQIFIYPMERDQAAKAIEEGPLPFLFNMKAAEARERYEIQILKSKDPAYYAVGIKPRLDVDKESFSHAFVYLERSYMLPVRIILMSPTGKGSKDFRLDNPRANTPVKDDNFVGKKLDNWKVVRNPAGQKVNDPAPARPDAPAVGARPAAAAPGAARR